MLAAQQHLFEQQYYDVTVNALKVNGYVDLCLAKDNALLLEIHSTEHLMDYCIPLRELVDMFFLLMHAIITLRIQPLP